MDSACGGSGSGNEGTSDSRKGKKPYHRHTTQQVQQLEAYFKEIPHPDENQRLELSRELGLDSKQIKFWFQNKRTQKKAQNERADNSALRAENERIQCENLTMREALKNTLCPSCQGSIHQVQDHEKLQGLMRLMTENSILKEQHEQALNLFSNYVEQSTSTHPGLENFPFIPGNNFPGDGMGTIPRLDSEQIPWNLDNPTSPYHPIGLPDMEKAVVIETALAAMDELVELLRMKDPVWIISPSDGRCVLHRDSYDKLFPKPSHFKSASARMESSKDSGEVAMEATQLVKMFLDPNKWKDVFPTIITKARTIEVLETGNFLNGSVQLMYEKMHILSPLVAPREYFFIRYIHQSNPKTWLMVDVSYDVLKQLQVTAPTRSWKLPSGCLIEDISNGKSFITWIEHVQVDDKTLTHRLYRELICTCHAYGAKRWIATLQGTCDRLSFSMGLTNTPKHDLERVINSLEGRKNLMRLSHRMVMSFWEVLSMSDRLDFPHLSELNNSGVRVSLRKSIGNGQPQGLIVTAATSLWLPFSYHSLFDFFNDETKRAQWDILSSGNSVNAIAHISTGSDTRNCVSIIQPFVPKENILMLQESSINSLGAFIVYAPVDLPAISAVVGGEDTMNIPILPSGYVISSDGRPDKGCRGSSGSSSTSGSLLTVAFQILACYSSTSKQLNMESVANVHSLISSTVQKIKVALGCPELD